MTLKDDLTAFTRDTFYSAWDERDGRKVPDDTSLTLKNEAIKIDGAILYADLADSTVMVDKFKNWFAAEIYKTYLYCCARIITAEGGTVTAYDGDRIMGVFIGDEKENDATRTALKIKWAVDEIIMPLLKERYKGTDFTLNHVIGIDASPLYVAKTGTRTANDLVWVGRAANYAAKLSSLPASYIYITAAVFNKLKDGLKNSKGNAMWRAVTWNTFNNATIYRTTYRITMG